MTSPPTFAEFVHAAHGYSPFPWQQRLADSLLAGQPPRFISVPTGLGKTSVLDAWAWSLAVASDDPRVRNVPTRAVFVVDRRVVVDAAYEHAAQLSAVLTRPDSAPTKWVAARLLRVGHELSSPLEVVRMRGGVSWSWRWLRQPDQPAVVVGTVDQFGSRFLFRGYGVGRRLRPIDAALVGTDAFVFVDEAHLSTALAHTVHACAEMDASVTRPAQVRSTTLIAMSATPPAGRLDDGSLLSIGDDDLDHPAAAARLAAVKMAELIDLPATSKPKAGDALAKELALRARDLASRGLVVAVVANTIDVARRTYELLRVAPKGADHVDAVLVIGRSRNLDREASRRSWWDRAAAKRVRSESAEGLVVVATQTIEVGADLDVDALVTEVAPIDALVQRFGRVDRLGELGATTSWVVRQPTRSAASANRVYGAAADATWEWLTTIAERGSIDFGSRTMTGRLAELGEGQRRALMAPTAEVPEVYPEVLHQLARTNPEPRPDHPIATYLHGMRTPQPSVYVLWRAGEDFHRLVTGDDSLGTRAIDVTTAEAIEVPIVQFLGFLRGDDDAAVLSDLDAIADAEDPVLSVGPPAGRDRVAPLEAVRIRDEQATVLGSPRELRAGDLVVLSSTAGGHDRFGWTGKADGRVVPDIADLVRSGTAQLRLDPAVLASLLGPLDAAEDHGTSLRSPLTRLNDQLRATFGNAAPSDTEISSTISLILSTVRTMSATGPLGAEIGKHLDRLESPGWSVVEERNAPDALRRGSCVVVSDVEVSEAGDVTIGSVRLVASTETVSLDAGDDSAVGSSALGGEVGLDQHLSAVGRRAADFARRIGLPDELVESLRLAGNAHDLGKVDARFQMLLRGGDRLAAEAFDGEPAKALAKSLPGRRGFRLEGEPEWCWPRGMRHEAVSVALLRSADLPDTIDRDLVEHLVASHHGWSRPLFPPVSDEFPRPVTAELGGRKLMASSDEVLVDWSQPGRFRRLCERYGWWGLAAIEAVLRLADIAVSEEGS